MAGAYRPDLHSGRRVTTGRTLPDAALEQAELAGRSQQRSDNRSGEGRGADWVGAPRDRLAAQWLAADDSAATSRPYA